MLVMELQNRQVEFIWIIWIPGHVEITFHDRVDIAARNATITCF